MAPARTTKATAARNNERNFMAELPLDEPSFRDVSLKGSVTRSLSPDIQSFPQSTRCSDLDSPNGPLFDINQYISTLHSQRKHLHPLMRRILRQTRLRIERPRMPRTNHRFALNPTLPQRPLPMRTQVIQRRQLAVHIRQANRHTLDLSFHHSSHRGSLPQTAQPYPLRHSKSSAISIL